MIAAVAPSVRKPSRLADEVLARLQESGHRTLCQLRVEERHGQVTVSGRVPSFYLKQMAQVIASTVDGVHRVCNETVVAPAEREPAMAG